jgi:hypothetical protein
MACTEILRLPVAIGVDCGDLFALQEDSNRTRITKYQSNEIPNIRTKL